MHLGILQTDNVLPAYREAHGDYPDMFRRLFGAVDAGIAFQTYDVQTTAPDAVECDAYIITGSKCSVYEDAPWILNLVRFVERVMAANRKVLGICFGHQLMAHYFGGEVASATQGWAVGVHTSQILEPLPFMADNANEVSMLSSHQDQVTRLPEGASLFLTNSFCPNAGFVMSDQVITVQGHPEFTKAYARDLMGYRREILGPEVYEAGIESLELPIHGDRVAQWMVDFVSQTERVR